MENQETCLDEIDLAAHVENRLPAGRKKYLEKHLTECEGCRHEFALVRQVASQLECEAGEVVPEDPIQRAVGYYPKEPDIVDAVIRFFKDSLKVIYTAGEVALSVPAPSTVVRHTRAISPTMVVLTRPFGEVDLVCDIEKLSGNVCNIKVVAYDSQTGKPEEEARIELVREGRVLASSRSGRSGILFEDMAAARYTVLVLRKGEICGTLTIKIEP